MPVGRIGVTPGPAMAAAEAFRVLIKGKGGHGASPYLTVDPIMAAVQVISALQSIVSRNVNALESAVVSVTTMRGGEAFNVIPAEVELLGTIRTYKPEVREMVLKRFSEIVEGVSASMGCQAEIEIEKVTPAVVNDAEISGRVQSIVKDMFAEEKLETAVRTMGSEDMAFMMDDIPGCYFFIGSRNSEKGLDAAHHNPRFDVDEQALTNGVALMAAAAADLLRE